MTDRCVLCGGQPNAPVRARWTIEIPIPIASQNGRDGKSGGANKGGNRWAYKRERTRYENALRHACTFAEYFTTRATGFRRVRFTRLWRPRQRDYDEANLVGGAKPLVDAMVNVGLLAGDTPGLFKGYYHQEKDPTGKGRTLIVIEELA